MADTNLTTSFKTEDTSLDESIEISLILDADRNNDQVEFAIGSDVFVKIMPTGDNNDFFSVNVGNVVKIDSNIPQVVTDEEVSFANSNTANLNYRPSGPVSWSWVGVACGNPNFKGREINLTSNAIGVLKCTYTTYFDRLKVTYSGVDEADVLLVCIRGAVQDSLVIPFVADNVTGATKDVTITVRDYCSDSIVSYANITVWGTGFAEQSFVCNDAGQVIIPDLVIGQTYNIKVTASGYRDSDQDSLDNASFIVE